MPLPAPVTTALRPSREKGLSSRGTGDLVPGGGNVRAGEPRDGADGGVRFRSPTSHEGEDVLHAGDDLDLDGDAGVVEHVAELPHAVDEEFAVADGEEVRGQPGDVGAQRRHVRAGP